MLYRIAQHGYITLAMYMSVILLLHFVICQDGPGTHDTRLLCIVEGELEYTLFLDT